MEVRLPWYVRIIMRLMSAPEYALDSQLSTANDLYSLGCVLYAVHMGGRPPFSNGVSMSNLKEHADGGLVRKDWMSGGKWDRCSGEIKGE
jgi:SCY1-like protein 2